MEKREEDEVTWFFKKNKLVQDEVIHQMKCSLVKDEVKLDLYFTDWSGEVVTR